MAKTVLHTLFPKSTLFDNYAVPTAATLRLDAHLHHVRRELLEQDTFQTAQDLKHTTIPQTTGAHPTSPVHDDSASNAFEQQLYLWEEVNFFSIVQNCKT